MVNLVTLEQENSARSKVPFVNEEAAWGWPVALWPMGMRFF